MSDKNARIRLNADVTAKLDAYCAATGANANDVVNVATAQFLFVAANENGAWAKMAQGVGQNGPEPAPLPAPAPQVPSYPQLGRTTGRPKTPYRESDTPEIRALVDVLNDLPDPMATTDEDTSLVRSMRVAEVTRQIMRLRQPEVYASK